MPRRVIFTVFCFADLTDSFMHTCCCTTCVFCQNCHCLSSRKTESVLSPCIYKISNTFYSLWKCKTKCIILRITNSIRAIYGDFRNSIYQNRHLSTHDTWFRNSIFRQMFQCAAQNIASRSNASRNQNICATKISSEITPAMVLTS